MFSFQPATSRANLTLRRIYSQHRNIHCTSKTCKASPSSSKNQISRGKGVLVESEQTVIPDVSQPGPSRCSPITSNISSKTTPTSTVERHERGNIPQKPKKAPTPRAYPPTLLTLNPDKLEDVNQSIIDLSNLTVLKLNIPPNLLEQPYAWRVKNWPRFNLRYHLTRTKTDLVFPEGTRGFLYYHEDETRTPLAGEIRFRICDSASTSFAPGSYDLAHYEYDDRPWSLPLAYLSQTKGTEELLELLTSEGMVPRDIVNTFKNSPTYPLDHNTSFIYELDEPFEYEIGVAKSVVLVTPEGLISIRTLYDAFIQMVPIAKNRPKKVARKPYTGKALVRLMPAPMENFPSLNIEWVKFETPLKYGDDLTQHNLVFPRPGTLMSFKIGMQKIPYTVHLEAGVSQMRGILRRWRTMFME